MIIFVIVIKGKYVGSWDGGLGWGVWGTPEKNFSEGFSSTLLIPEEN